jgi:hypothetical protein
MLVMTYLNVYTILLANLVFKSSQNQVSSFWEEDRVNIIPIGSYVIGETKSLSVTTGFQYLSTLNS